MCTHSVSGLPFRTRLSILIICGHVLHGSLQIKNNHSVGKSEDTIQEFDQSNVGVYFQPFVKKFNLEERTASKLSYTFEDMKTMLTVVSRNFSKVLVDGSHTFLGGPYAYNLTYKYASYASVYAGEAAAHINRENRRKVLTLMYTANVYHNTETENTKEVLLALEATEKANKIFPGTVNGICFFTLNFPDLQRAARLIRFYRKSAQFDLKIGIIINCNQVTGPQNGTIDGIHQQIIADVDIIICSLPENSLDASLGTTTNEFMKYRNAIREVKTNAQVIAALRKCDVGETLKAYWEAANAWVKQNNVSVYMFEAFDNPWTREFVPGIDNCGWWKLTEDSKVNSIEGYVEKIDVKHSKNTSVQSVNPVTTERTVPTQQEFNSEYVGVSFQPYVAYPKAEKHVNVYTRKNIATMLVVVSGKFRKLLVGSISSLHGKYVHNLTYHHSGINVYSAEEPALINHKNKNKSLTLHYNVDPITHDLKSDPGVLLAFEAAEKASTIFPGTVEGISISGSANLENFSWGNFLDYLRSHRERASQLGTKLGINVNWRELLNPEDGAVLSIQQQVLSESDFVIFDMVSKSRDSGPIASFQQMTYTLLLLRDYIRKANPNSNVIAMTEWSSSGMEKEETIENMAVYWHAVNKWASLNNYSFYLNEAFDTWTFSPPKNREHLGWWKLTDGAKINLIGGYVEKLLDEKTKQIDGENDFVSKNWEYVYTTLSAVGISMLTLTFAVLFFLFWRQRNKTVLSAEETRQFLYGVSNMPMQSDVSAVDSALMAPYCNSLEISKDKINIDRFFVLGSGEFGCVYKAEVEISEDEHVEVALKVAKSKSDFAAVKGMLTEIKIMSYLGKHENIIALIGAYTAELSKGILYVATELATLGSLENFLRKPERSVNTTLNSVQHTTRHEIELSQTPVVHISFMDMVRWSYEIACAMEFLEEKRVVHADLATRNVLLTSDKTAKITDFGFSRRMYAYTDVVKEEKRPLPWRWMAIETLKEMSFSSKSDVWSYGVTVWEIFSKGCTPYPGLNWDQEFVQQLKNGLRLKPPSLATPEIYQFMHQCWRMEPNDRPQFRDLVNEANRLYQKHYSHDENGESLYTCLGEQDD